MMNKKLFLRWAPPLLVVVTFYFLFQKISFAEFAQNIAQFSWKQILGIVFWSFVYAALQGVRFGSVQRRGLSLWQHIGLNFCNHSGNILLPFRLGEFLRPFYMMSWKPEIKIKDLFKWTLFDKAGELVSMLIFISVIILAYRFYDLQSPELPAVFVIFTLVVSAASLRIFFKAPEQAPSKSVGLRWIIFMALATWTANTLGIYSLTDNLQLSLAMLVSMTLAGALPLFPAGLGAAQGAFVAISELIQISQAQALAYSTVVHLIWILLRVSIGIPLLLAWGWPKSEDLQNLRDAKQP